MSSDWARPGAAGRGVAGDRVTRPTVPYGDPAAVGSGLLLAERCVCVVEGGGGGGGTGILIAPDHVLTNHHVVHGLIDGTADLAAAECRFDYATASDGKPAAGGHAVPIAEVVTSSAPSPGEGRDNGSFAPDRLDYAVLRLKSRIGELPCAKAARRGWITLPERPPSPDLGAPIYVLQHPRGDGYERFQQPVRLFPGEILRERGGGARIVHDAMTDEGSSGSPCFEQDGFRFIALHNAGGQAVPLDRIVDHLRSNRRANWPFIGVVPRADDEARLAAALVEQQQLLARSIADRRRVAFCLMDRAKEESRFLSAPSLALVAGSNTPPLVHVVIARAPDQPDYFLDRLKHLSFGTPLPARESVWREVLRKGLVTSGRRAAELDWPPLDASDPNDLFYRKSQVGGYVERLSPRERHVLLLRREIDQGWDRAVERDLLAHFAAKLGDAFKADPEAVRAIVAFVVPEGEVGERLAEIFATMWGLADTPPFCGSCVVLREIERDDLNEWRECLRNAWGDNARLEDRIATVFRARRRLRLGQVASDITDSLDSYIREMLSGLSTNQELRQ